MYKALYAYLVRYGRLTIPGVGILVVERQAAVMDFTTRTAQPASYRIALQHSAETGSETAGHRLFGWLAGALNIHQREAVIRFNDFVFDLKKKLRDGARIRWAGVGTLSTGLAGEIRFEAAVRDFQPETAVTAERIIREQSEHTVRVGEDEKTSTEMKELLAPVPAQRNSWLLIAAILLLLTLLFAGWYLSQHGLKPTAIGVQSSLPLAPTPVTYDALP
ncbi:hypothetical protein JMG10_20715 [Nostoc ellipsosporum NOK]|nr:hypothetical protein [Nostoc ellipsosporum NOK]